MLGSKPLSYGHGGEVDDDADTSNERVRDEFGGERSL